ncbi:hypothetical protein HDU90_000483 [Geranomyces variabilis]|nr:hypothetical protein HDU90_000483 [Geranomyces variabilis]
MSNVEDLIETSPSARHESLGKQLLQQQQQEQQRQIQQQQQQQQQEHEQVQVQLQEQEPEQQHRQQRKQYVGSSAGSAAGLRVRPRSASPRHSTSQAPRGLDDSSLASPAITASGGTATGAAAAASARRRSSLDAGLNELPLLKPPQLNNVQAVSDTVWFSDHDGHPYVRIRLKTKGTLCRADWHDLSPKKQQECIDRLTANMHACAASDSDREAARLRELITYMDRHKRPLMLPASAKRGAPVDEEIADGSSSVSRKRIASPAAAAAAAHAVNSAIGSTSSFGSGPGPALPVVSGAAAIVLSTAGPPYHLPPPRSSQSTQSHYSLYHGQPAEPPTQLMAPHPQFAQPDPPAMGHPPPPRPPPLVGGGAFSAYGAQAQQSQQQQQQHPHHHQPSYNHSQQQHPPPPPAHPSQMHHFAHPAPYSHHYSYSDSPHAHHQLPPPHPSQYTQQPQQQQQPPPPQHPQQQQPAGDDPYTSRVVRDLQDACVQLRFENRDLRQEVASLHHEVHVTRQQAEMYKRRWEDQLPAATLSPPAPPIAPRDADRQPHYQPSSAAAAAAAADERRPSTPLSRSQHLSLPPAGPCGAGGSGAGAAPQPPPPPPLSTADSQLHHRVDHRLEALLSKHAPPVHELLADAMRRTLYELHHEITADPPPPPRPPQPPPNPSNPPPPLLSHPNGKG